MNWFDLWVIHFVNSFAHRSWLADAILVEISGNVLLAAGLLMVMFWWAWMGQGREDIEKRKTLSLTLATTTFAVLVARCLAVNLPFRQRPLRNPLLHFQLPYTSNPDMLIHWSAFPSDHAVLYFCVATGLLFVSKRLGILALGYAAFMSVLRIYIGAHYPTDIVGGALLGTGIAFLAKIGRLRDAAGKALDYMERRPALLYILLFAWTYEIGEMFDSLRHIGILTLAIARRYPSWPFLAVGSSLFAATLLAASAWLLWRRRHRQRSHGLRRHPNWS